MQKKTNDNQDIEVWLDSTSKYDIFVTSTDDRPFHKRIFDAFVFGVLPLLAILGLMSMSIILATYS